MSARVALFAVGAPEWGPSCARALSRRGRGGASFPSRTVREVLTQLSTCARSVLAAAPARRHLSSAHTRAWRSSIPSKRSRICGI